MALHLRLEGQLQIQRYLTRGLSQLPYGAGASLAHVVGSDRGGGYEWRAAPSAAPFSKYQSLVLLGGNTSPYSAGRNTWREYQGMEVTLINCSVPSKSGASFCPDIFTETLETRSTPVAVLRATSVPCSTR